MHDFPASHEKLSKNAEAAESKKYCSLSGIGEPQSPKILEDAL